MRESQRPEVVVSEQYGMNRETESHPAYGVAVITLPNSSSGQSMFGSETKHRQTVCISVFQADVERSLSNDWTHQRGLICEFEMTHSQFASLITNPGNGCGVPVTLQRHRGGPIIDCPMILPNATTNDTFKNEIKEAARERVEGLLKETTKLDELIESGKLSKKELREIAKELRRHCGQFGGSVAFVVDQAEEAFEKIVEKSKVEIESFIDNKARKIGYDVFREGAPILKIENVSKPDA
jgi:hypothetical protein